MIRELFENHSGHVVDKWSSYIDYYESLFEKYGNSPVHILEIGIANGGSLELWGEIFKHQDTIIVGVDIDEKCGELTFDDERIHVVIGDVNLPETKASVEELCNCYDIIVEDGSHLCSDVIKTFANYFPLLGANSIYIAEDLHTSYWLGFGGKLRHPLTSMSFFKRLADIPNYEHWRNGMKRADYLKYFSAFYKIDFPENELATIHSVSFRNSMAIVERKSILHNNLGVRIVRGDVQSVSENAKLSDLTNISILPESIEDDWYYDPFELIIRMNQLEAKDDNSI